MINKEDIVRIIDKGKLKGVDIKARDVAYLLLCGRFEDKNLVYRMLFGSDSSESEIKTYENGNTLKELRGILRDEKISIHETSMTGASVAREITFEENKEALIKLLDEIKAQADEGMIERKDAIKMETDIRIKLNDKFNVADDSTQQYVVVNTKFNNICEYTGHECWLQTKEFAKEHWGLCEKEELMEKLRKEYELTPKVK